MTMRRAVAVSIGAWALLPAAASAQDRAPAWLGGSVYQENDSLVTGDERYTQGLRFNLVKRQAPRWATTFRNKLDGKLWSSGSQVDPIFGVFFGQNLYTPEIITARDPYPGDRRFAGVLYGGAQLQLLQRGQRWRHTLEVSAGFRGTASLAGEAQKDLHVLRFRRIPKGWEQAPDGLVGNLYYRYDHRLPACRNGVCFFDVTFGGLGALGNVQTAAGAHVAARLGYGLTGFPAAAISNAADRESRKEWEVGGIAGWEGRAVAYNGLLRPSVEDGTFSIERIVRDKRFGGYLRYKDVRLTVLKVRRSPEFAYAGVRSASQDFASVSLSYEPLEFPEDEPRFLFRDWHFELGMGSAPLAPKLAGGDRRRGPSARVGIGKGIPWDLRVGFELGGTVVEDHPGPSRPDRHRDSFLLYRAVTLGWAPAFADRRLVVRAGPTLFGSLAKVETTDNHLEGGRPVEELSASYQDGRRTGWIAGVQYAHPLQRVIALGLGATYAHLRFDDPVPGFASPRFVTLTATVEIRP